MEEIIKETIQEEKVFKMGFIHKKDTVYWKAISSLFLGSFVTFASLYCTQPLIPLFSQQFQVSPALASLSVSLTTELMSFFMLVVSWVSDAKGRKLIMGISLLLSAMLEIVIALSNNFTSLLVLRALQGITLAGYPAIAMVYITEEFEPATSGLVMGIYISGNSIGGLTGRMLIGALTDLFSWHIALVFIGVISLFAGIWFWLNLPDSRNFSPRPRVITDMLSVLWRTAKQPSLLILFIMGFLVMGGFVTFYNYIGYPLMAPPYNLSQTLVGFIFVAYLVGTFSSTWMGNLADHIGRPKVACLSICIMLAGCLVTLFLNLYLKIAGVAIFTFGFFGSYSVVSSWVGQCAKTDKAQASSLYLLFHYTGASVIGAWGGRFLSSYGWNGVVMLTAAALILALMLLSVFFSGSMRRKENQNVAAC
ncbi:Inner membrane transport protein YnfM [Sporomusa carbonis]|uniref:MFS transporter n=1 Tax=Sporomusa carbonis TaxID=3076075 RepID=UPI003A7654CF